MQHTVILDENEIMLARTIASLRTGNNRVAGTSHNVHIDGQDNFRNDLLGICGEIVFAKTYNIYLDLCFHIRSGGPDFKISDKTVDVKTTHHRNGRLIVPLAKKDKQSDMYVLVTGDLPKFTIRGYATAEEVFSSLDDVGHGPCFVITQDKLHAFKK